MTINSRLNQGQFCIVTLWNTRPGGVYNHACHDLGGGPVASLPASHARKDGVRDEITTDHRMVANESLACLAQEGWEHRGRVKDRAPRDRRSQIDVLASPSRCPPPPTMGNRTPPGASLYPSSYTRPRGSYREPCSAGGLCLGYTCKNKISQTEVMQDRNNHEQG